MLNNLVFIWKKKISGHPIVQQIRHDCDSPVNRRHYMTKTFSVYLFQMDVHSVKAVCGSLSDGMGGARVCVTLVSPVQELGPDMQCNVSHRIYLVHCMHVHISSFLKILMSLQDSFIRSQKVESIICMHIFGAGLTLVVNDDIIARARFRQLIHE